MSSFWFTARVPSPSCRNSLDLATLTVSDDEHKSSCSSKMTAFWDIAPCSLAEVDGRCRGAYCLRHQGEIRSTSTRLHGATSQKTAIFILAAAIIWNLTNFILNYKITNFIRIKLRGPIGYMSKCWCDISIYIQVSCKLTEIIPANRHLHIHTHTHTHTHTHRRRTL
jgi:hypothetical protein